MSDVAVASASTSRPYASDMCDRPASSWPPLVATSACVYESPGYGTPARSAKKPAMAAVSLKMRAEFGFGEAAPERSQREPAAFVPGLGEGSGDEPEEVAGYFAILPPVHRRPAARAAAIHLRPLPAARQPCGIVTWRSRVARSPGASTATIQWLVENAVYACALPARSVSPVRGVPWYAMASRRVSPARAGAGSVTMSRRARCTNGSAAPLLSIESTTSAPLSKTRVAVGFVDGQLDAFPARDGSGVHVEVELDGVVRRRRRCRPTVARRSACARAPRR